MSTLLKEIIADLRAKRIEYEEYLKRIAELAKHVQVGQADDTPEPLKHSSGLRALYNNLKRDLADHQKLRTADPLPSYMGAAPDQVLDLTMKIDTAIRLVKPDGWRGVQTREQVIKKAIYDVLRDADQVERIFVIIKQQREY